MTFCSVCRISSVTQLIALTESVAMLWDCFGEYTQIVLQLELNIYIYIYLYESDKFSLDPGQRAQFHFVDAG